MQAEPSPEQASRQPAAAETHQQGAELLPGAMAAALKQHRPAQQGQGEEGRRERCLPHQGGLEEHRHRHQQHGGQGKQSLARKAQSSGGEASGGEGSGTEGSRGPDHWL